MATTLKDIEQIKKRILIYLVEFFFEQGYTSETYKDKATGGIFENKVAYNIGLKVTFDNKPPDEFVTAAEFLEEEGLVTRKIRNPNHPVKGIWPTRRGIELVNSWNLSKKEKVVQFLKTQSTTIITSSITSLITVIITYILSVVFAVL
jgi:hypothetical protein